MRTAGLLFHNARLREILGYSKDELDLCDTRTHLARPRSAHADHRRNCAIRAASF